MPGSPRTGSTGCRPSTPVRRPGSTARPSWSWMSPPSLQEPLADRTALPGCRCSLLLRDGPAPLSWSSAPRVGVVTSRSNGEPLVRLSGVNKWFGELHVLQDIDLDVARGEVVVVIGPSGSGKSTLCRTINRLESIEKGEIAIDGERLPEEGKELARLRSDVGMVFQSFNLFAHKTILENVTLGPIKVR